MTKTYAAPKQFESNILSRGLRKLKLASFIRYIAALTDVLDLSSVNISQAKAVQENNRLQWNART